MWQNISEFMSFSVIMFFLFHRTAYILICTLFTIIDNILLSIHFTLI